MSINDALENINEIEKDEKTTKKTKKNKKNNNENKNKNKPNKIESKPYDFIRDIRFIPRTELTNTHRNIVDDHI